MLQKLSNWRVDPSEKVTKELLEKLFWDFSEKRKLRDLNNNSLLGIISSVPTPDSDERILGISYYDKREGEVNEDLFLIQDDIINRLTTREVMGKYPKMYRGYHKESKDFFRRCNQK